MTKSQRHLTDPVPRLEHHSLEQIENIWFGIAAVMSFLLFMSAFASFISGTYPGLNGASGHHLAGVVNGRLDPKLLAATPFAKPGLHQNPDGSLDVFVVTRAFQFEPAVLHVPAGKPLTFYVTSADVLHGYSVDGTNINVTSVPGQVASFTTTFRHAGTYNTVCNEYCGIGHHNMVTRMIVDPPQ